jgi:hypothetical protein
MSNLELFEGTVKDLVSYETGAAPAGVVTGAARDGSELADMAPKNEHPHPHRRRGILRMRRRWLATLGAGVLLALAIAPPAYAEMPPWLKEFNEQNAKEVAEKAAAREKTEHEAATKAANEAAERKVAEERQQREAAERQQAEATKQAEEAAQRQSNEAAAKQCVVPSLKGDSVTSARKALGKAHCRLGKVKTPHGAHGLLVVTGQSVKSGSKRPSGTAVTVTLGAAKRSHT